MSKKIYNCTVSGKEIPEERVEALKMLGVPEDRWTCVENSFAKPKQGIFMGEVGGSEMRVVDKVYNDSVRAVFKHADRETEEELDEEDKRDEKTKFYSDKEIQYYAQDDEDVSEEDVSIVKKIDI
jgi:RNA polymerase-binding transcription factor DksA